MSIIIRVLLVLGLVSACQKPKAKAIENFILKAPPVRCITDPKMEMKKWVVRGWASVGGSPNEHAALRPVSQKNICSAYGQVANELLSNFVRKWPNPSYVGCGCYVTEKGDDVWAPGHRFANNTNKQIADEAGFDLLATLAAYVDSGGKYKDEVDELIRTRCGLEPEPMTLEERFPLHMIESAYGADCCGFYLWRNGDNLVRGPKCQAAYDALPDHFSTSH